MEKLTDTGPEKLSFKGKKEKEKTSSEANDETVKKGSMLRKLLHPDYILFDWEFFSNQLEFE